MDLLGHLAYAVAFRCQAKSEKKKSQVSGTVRDSVLTDCHGIPLLSSVGICIEVGLSV